SGDWPDLVREAAGQVDVVFDGVGGEVGRAAFGLLGPGGRFYPFGMASGSFAPVTPELATEHGVTLLRGGPANAEEAVALTRTALAEAAAGRVPPVRGQGVGWGPAAAGGWPGVRLGRGLGRARRDRGPGHGRQDPARGAALSGGHALS